MALEQAAELCLKDQGFVWLGLFEPDEDELTDVQERFGLHDLAVEDAQNFHLRPKIERYEEGSVLFAVFRTARYVEEREEVDVGEVSVFLSRRFVITVRQGEASDLHGARMRLEERPELLKEGTAAVLWAILDTIVDDYAPVIEGLEKDVEEVERDRVQRRGRADRADLPPAPRGDRFLPRGPPAAGAARGARARGVRLGEPKSCLSSSATSTIT